MNRIEASVTAIEQHDNISIVSFEADGQPMRMMALDLTLPVEVGSRVILGFKASHVALGRGVAGEISLSNRLDAVIESVETGALLGSVMLRVGPALIESIITRESAERMHLKAGDAITAFIKASDLSVMDVS